MQRKTIQSALVLEAVNKLHNHATADEIYEYIAKEHPSIGRGTVYRNLRRLCETGDIRKVEVPDGADRYDHIEYDHYHVRCEECGRIFDVRMPYMKDLERSAAAPDGFVVTGHIVLFKGVCPDCRQKNRQITNHQTEV